LGETPEAFLAAYYRHVAAEDVLARDPSQLSGLAFSHRQLAMERSAYADLATIGLAGAMGLLGWAGYASMIYVGAGEVPGNTVGAFVAALASTLLIRRTSIKNRRASVSHP
jgi:glutamate dehydrogenase